MWHEKPGFPEVMFCMIWYHLYNLNNVKNTRGAVLLLIKLQASTSKFTKSNTLHGSFSRGIFLG